MHHVILSSFLVLHGVEMCPLGDYRYGEELGGLAALMYPNTRVFAALGRERLEVKAWQEMMTFGLAHVWHDT